MKFKHVLFSGLLMSTAFVACTNEEFQEVGNQASMKDAISLGEGFTISGSIMKAQTRAIYEDETTGTAVSIKSLWEPNDQIGAAWYAARTGEGVGFLFDTDKFASNHPYERENKEGNVAKATFKTVTNSFAGKYVLYFPYNDKVAATSAAIPVVSETAQTMDVAKPLAHVNKNMFFYDNQEYKTGGNQLAQFELKPVPVLYRLSFRADEKTRGLVGKVISKVVVSTGVNNHLYSTGKVSVTTATSYAEAVAGYAGVDATNVYTLDLTGNETNTDYQVSAIGNEGGMKKPIYLSVLPASGSITSLDIKVITTDGAVFTKTLDLSALTNVKTNITKEGGLFSSNITLDEVGTADGEIYTTQQFNKAWDAALVSGETKTVTLGAPLNLETLTMSEAGSEITIKGSELTVDKLTIEDGTLSVENLKAKDVNIAQFGELTTTGVTISGDLTVNGKATLGGVESLNNVVADRKSTLSITGAAASKKIKGTFTSNIGSEVTLKTIELDGAATLNGAVSTNNVTFNKATTLNTLNTKNVQLTATGTTTFKEDVTNKGTIVNSSSHAINFEKKLINDGTVTIGGTGVTFKGTTTNNGTVTVGAATTNNGTFINRGVLTLTYGLTNAANATLTLDKNPAGDADITNNGTVNVTAADVEAKTATSAALNIVNNKTLNINLPAATKEVTFKKLTNSGKVNIEKGIVKETAANAITQTAGEIRIGTDAKISFTGSHTAITDGYILVKGDKSAAMANENGQEVACFFADMATATDADYVIINEATSLTANQITAVQAKNLILRANLELQADMEMAANTSFTVEGEVTLTASATATLSFDSSGTTLTVGTDSLLKVSGENITLDASSVATGNFGKNGYGSIVAVNGGTLTTS